MTEPTTEPATDETIAEGPDDQLREATKKYEAERKVRARVERELAQLRASSLSESEKAVEEARAAGRKEGAKQAGVRLVAAEFRAKAAEARLPNLGPLLDVLDLTRFVDDDGEPDSDAIQAAVERISEGLATTDSGKAAPKAPDIPKGVHPKSAADTDWLRSLMKQG
jgi:O-succinylbenzoate synthase